MNAGINALNERIEHAAQERDRAPTAGDRLRTQRKLSSLLKVWERREIGRMETELNLRPSRGGSL